VILLRYVELESEVRRALAIIKMRDGDHNRNIVEVEISTGGLTVKGKFEGLTGVLGGTPQLATPEPPMSSPSTDG
jgi:circadian clock protein KaiC